MVATSRARYLSSRKRQRSTPASQWPTASLRWCWSTPVRRASRSRSEEHTSELQSLAYLVCRLLLEKKKKKEKSITSTTTVEKLVHDASHSVTCTHLVP